MSVAEWTSKQAVLRDLAEVTQGIVPSRFNKVTDRPGRYVVEDEGIDEEYFRYYNGDGHLAGPDISSITQMLKMVKASENSEEDYVSEIEFLQDRDIELRKWNINAKEFVPNIRENKSNNNVQKNGIRFTNGEFKSTKVAEHSESPIQKPEPTVIEKPEISKEVEPPVVKKKKKIRNIAMESILANIEKETGTTVTPDIHVSPVPDKITETSTKNDVKKLVSPKKSPTKNIQASTSGTKKVSSYTPPALRKKNQEKMLTSNISPYSSTSMFSKKTSSPLTSGSPSSSEKDLSKGPVLSHTSMFKRNAKIIKPVEVKPEEPKTTYPKFEPKPVPKDAFKKVHVNETGEFEKTLQLNIWESLEDKFRVIDENKKKQAEQDALIEKRMEELDWLERFEMVDIMPDYPEICALDIHRHFLDGACAVCKIRASIELKNKKQ